MIKVRIGDTGFVVEGHANHDEYGKDIVCASVSTITQLVEIIMKEIHSEVITHKESGHHSLSIPQGALISQCVLRSMKQALKYIQEDYPGYIEIVEVKED